MYRLPIEKFAIYYRYKKDQWFIAVCRDVATVSKVKKVSLDPVGRMPSRAISEPAQNTTS